MKHFLSLLIVLFVLTSCGDSRTNVPPPSNLPAIYVLFVGDAYTSSFDMPVMLEYISRTNAEKGFQIKTAMAVKPNMNLDQLWNDPDIQKIFKERKWDFVVLQPPGTWAVENQIQRGAYEGARVWSLAAQQNGAKPVWFMTWIRKPGTEWYSQKNFVAITRSPEFMYQHIHKQSQKLVDGYKMMIVPVGDYWFYSDKKHPEIPLYGEDGNFPSLQGSFLNSLIFYRYLTGVEINENTYRPPELSHEQFLGLRNLASQTVR
ncbi:MAG: hypothetical protein OEY94_06160 [Alphaproteobacteria bacterium]|nr:hypothetical protein [Alphaproteobacteria bacterium]